MIFICGDLHGEFAQLLLSVQSIRPAAVILLGDQTPENDEILHQLNDVSPVWFILGNHDGDKDCYLERHRWLMELGRDLSGRVQVIDGHRVAGLGGVFREKQVWMPPKAPVHCTRRALAQRTPQQTRFWQGPARKHWASIWYEDYECLSRQRADILVTHEAPETLPSGFKALGDLARSLGAQRYFHGHHHVNYTQALPESSCIVEGVGLCAIKCASGDLLMRGVPHLLPEADNQLW